MQGYEDWRAIFDQLSIKGVANAEQKKFINALKFDIDSILRHQTVLAGEGKSWLKPAEKSIRKNPASPFSRHVASNNLTLSATLLQTQLIAFELLMSSFAGPAKGRSDRTLAIINDAARSLCLAALTCPVNWIDHLPHELVIREADRQDPFNTNWQRFLEINTQELEWLRNRRQALIQSIDDAQRHTDKSQNPILHHFLSILEHIDNRSPFSEPRKNRYRNTNQLKSNHRDKLNIIIRQHPECQVVTPLFGIIAPELSDDAQQELLKATWGEFAKFKQKQVLRNMGYYHRSTNLLYDHLVWYMFKEHWFPLSASNGLRLNSYISAMLFFQEGTFSTRLNWRNTQYRDGRKVNPMPDHEVLVELRELWHIALIQAQHKNKYNHPEYQSHTIKSFVCSPRADARQNYLGELPSPQSRNDGLRFIESLSPKNKKLLTEKLKSHLKSLIFRDQALMVTPLSTENDPANGSKKTGKRTIGSMGNSRKPKPLGTLADGSQAYWHPPSAPPPPPWMFPLEDGNTTYKQCSKSPVLGAFPLRRS